jgi:hypothetical protein
LSPRVAFCTLGAEDLGKLPAGELSLIGVRAALHHVLDVGKFFADASRALSEQGLLIFQEPFAEGHIVIGALAELMPRLAAVGGNNFKN